MYRPEVHVRCLPQLPSIYFLRKGLSLNLELTDSVVHVVHQALGILLSLLPSVGITYALCYVDAGDLKIGFLAFTMK